MRIVHPLALALLLAGSALMAGAFGWWALTYWPVWSYDYLPVAQASRCLLADSTICRLAASLCTGQHRAWVSIYTPTTFRIGATVAAAGLAIMTASLASASRRR